MALHIQWISAFRYRCIWADVFGGRCQFEARFMACLELDYTMDFISVQFSPMSPRTYMVKTSHERILRAPIEHNPTHFWLYREKGRLIQMENDRSLYLKSLLTDAGCQPP